jgi:branched-chain amino acid transport system permease protein
MDNFLQQLINGLTLGSIYGLIAIGYTMVFGIIGMVNFAHGDVFMLSAFIALIIFMILTQILHLGSLPIAFVVVLVAAMALTGLWNWAIERLAYRPLRGSFRLAPLISAIGMSIFLSNFVQVVQGPRNKPAPQLPNHVFNVTGDVTLSVRQILIVVVTAVLLAAFWYLVKFTSLGRAQRACEQDRKMAALLGIDVDATISITFVIGAALAAVAGVMFVIYYGVVSFSDGFVPGVKAFTAAVLGGIGSLPGGSAGRPPDRPHRGVLVVLLHHRLQGCGRVHDFGDHADLHAFRHSGQAGSREGLRHERAFTNLGDRGSRCNRGPIRSGAPQRGRRRIGRLLHFVPDYQLPCRIEHQ